MMQWQAAGASASAACVLSILERGMSMINRKTTPMVVASYFAAIMVILALFSNFVPLFVLIGFFLMPIPMVVLYMTYGLRWSLMTGVVAGILLGFFLQPILALIQIVTFGSVGLLLGKGFKEEWTPFKMLSGVTFILVVVNVVALLAMYVFMDMNLYQLMQQQVITSSQMLMDGYRESGMSEVQLVEMQQQVSDMIKIIPTLLPLFFCIAISIIAYMNIKITQMILVKLGYHILPFLSVRYWEISRSMLYFYVLAMVLKYWGMTRKIDWLTIVGLNLEQLSVFFIAIQGIAFVLYLIHRRTKLGTGIQIVVVVLLLLEPHLHFFALIMGFFDMVLNYRKKRA